MAETPEQTARKRRVLDPLRSLASLFGVTHAILYALMTRAWQVIAGPVTIVLIAQRYSPAEQGFYYAFASILAMQAFFELGFFSVITNVTAHEWAHLRWGESGQIEGDLTAHSRLRSLARFNVPWYGTTAILFLASVTIIGWNILSQREYADVVWQPQWIALVAITAAQLLCLPFNAMLEGCDRVAEVNLFRIVQASLGSLALWLTIWSGGGLWAPVAAGATTALCNLVFYYTKFGAFFRDLFGPVEGPSISWRKELWPLQFRIGIQTGLGWFRSFLFVPVLFYYHGPVLAGQFGMTWQMVVVLQAAAYAWIQTRVPEMGSLIAKRDYEALDGLFYRSSRYSMLMMTTGAIAVQLLVSGLALFFPRFAERLLPPWQVTPFLAGMICMHFANMLAAYVRAHKIEPFALMSIASALLQGALVWQLGMRFGATGQGYAFMGVMLAVNVPWSLFILANTRRDEQRSRST